MLKTKRKQKKSLPLLKKEKELQRIKKKDYTKKKYQKVIERRVSFLYFLVVQTKDKRRFC